MGIRVDTYHASGRRRRMQQYGESASAAADVDRQLACSEGRQSDNLRAPDLLADEQGGSVEEAGREEAAQGRGEGFLGHAGSFFAKQVVRLEGIACNGWGGSVRLLG
ncbi:MAG TPA: hypothetical protein VG497_02585 [Kribbella sp.]|nr:hypothetical protein [Kribbella sp.]